MLTDILQVSIYLAVIYKQIEYSFIYGMRLEDIYQKVYRSFRWARLQSKGSSVKDAVISGRQEKRNNPKYVLGVKVHTGILQGE